MVSTGADAAGESDAEGAGSIRCTGSARALVSYPTFATITAMDGRKIAPAAKTHGYHPYAVTTAISTKQATRMAIVDM